MRKWLEYAMVRALVALLGSLPRGMARSVGAVVGASAYLSLRRLRNVGHQNLQLAFPEKSPEDRTRILRRLYRNLGWLLAEFCHMSRYTRQNTPHFLRYEGLEHYLAARERGKGVLIVTGHLGAWELSSYFHSLMGHPMSIVIRRLDNPRKQAAACERRGHRIQTRCIDPHEGILLEDFPGTGKRYFGAFPPAAWLGLKQI